MMGKRVLYNLVAASPTQRFRPYCFRVELALVHKELAFHSVLIRFTDKEAIAFSGS